MDEDNDENFEKNSKTNDKKNSVFQKLTSFFKKDEKQENIIPKRTLTTSQELRDSKHMMKSKKSKLKSHLNNLNKLKNTSVFSQASALSQGNKDNQNNDDKKNKKKFEKIVNEKGYMFKTGVPQGSIFTDLRYGDMVFEFDNIDSYSMVENYELIRFEEGFKIFMAELHKQTPDLDFDK